MVGWGNLAQELQSRVQVGQRLMLEGRLRMNTVPRQDGMKEKRAEFTLARMHPITPGSSPQPSQPAAAPTAAAAPPAKAEPEAASWNAAPLVPDTDEIPF